MVCLLLLFAHREVSPMSRDGLREATAHLERARAHAEHDEWEAAAREAAAAAALLRQGGGDLPEALEVLGLAEVMLGRPSQAVDHLREGVALCRSCAERGRLRICLASAYRDLGRYGEAVSLLQEALQEARAAGQSAEQVTIFKSLAAVSSVQGRYAEAIGFFQEALRRTEAGAQPDERAELLEVLGVLLSKTGEGAPAVDALRQAEDLTATLGNRLRLSRVRTNLAKAYMVVGRYDTALALLGEVEKASRQGGDPKELARALTSSAEVLQRRGRYGEAEQRLEEALQIERRTGKGGGQANVLNQLAQLDLLQGRYDLALSRFEEALTLARAAGDRESEATSLLHGSEAFLELHRPEEALARQRRALELMPDKGAQGPFVEALIETLRLFSLGRLEEALQRLDHALALEREIGTRPGEERALVIRAALLTGMGRLEEGRRDAEAALAISRELGEKDQEAQDDFLLGFILLLDHRYQDSQPYLERSLALQRASGVSGRLSSTLWALGAVHEKLWQTTPAIARYREAADLAENAFMEVRADDLLAGLAEKAIGPYGRWAHLLARNGDAAQSFAVAERARARAFLRRMGNPPADLQKSGDSALAREEQSLRAKVERLSRRLQQEQAKPLGEQDRLALAATARELDSARREYGTLLTRLQEVSPEYASLVHPSPLTLPEVQKLLDGNTTLVEYFLLEDESLAWAVDRDSVHLVHLTVDAAEVARRVEELRRRIAAREPVQWYAASLYLRLFRPLVPYIRHPNVILVPHGALHALPFAALTSDFGKTFLVDDYALSTLPSASVLPFVLAKRNPGGGGMLALGDPDGSLPEAAAEARAVAALYGTRALVGREASAAALRRAPRPVDQLHISAHAAFDPVRPLFSRIRLADGDLSVHDIFGLDLRGTHLVVLSGCETGLGHATEGDELDSMARAFLYAGAPAVLATQWAVDDAASRALMEAFYRRLRAGVGTAEALRQAQVELLHGKDWKAPFFWAGYTLAGDAGRAGERHEGVGWKP
jgi:CHAT domain-containing protein